MPQRNLGLQGFPYLVQPYGEGNEKPTYENHISDEAGTLVPRPPKPRRRKRVHECKADEEERERMILPRRGKLPLR